MINAWSTNRSQKVKQFVLSTFQEVVNIFLLRKMGFLEERDLKNVPNIPEYYKGKTIFITGGTGFMGKILIEKLLYSCTDLDKIYLLLRCKKGVNPKDRLHDLYSLPCFDRLRNEKPNVFESKVFVIPGDIMEIGLGMSKEDREILINNVNIIFHVAASVRFDDPLKFAATMNLRGTKEVMALATDVKNLSSLIHVSTSYSNTNRNPVEEVMYPPHADWRDILNICEEVDEHTVRVLTAKLLGVLPNTYAFTKQLAEHVVYEHRGLLPAVIFRPSIVISSVDEPVKGWVDNFNGPVGLLVASGKGIMRSIYTDPNLISDYMPVDVSIKALITAAWARGTKKLEPTDDIPIYNCCSSQINMVTMGEIVEMGRQLTTNLPLDNILWNVGGSLTTSPTVHYFKVIFMHLLPAILVDTLLWILGKKPMLVKIQRRIYIANIALLYYITQQWTFDIKNFLSLRASIKEEDRKQFYYEMETVDHNEFIYNACLGAKKYLLKEKLEDIPKARAHHRRMWLIEKVLQSILFALFVYWLINSERVHNFTHSLFQSIPVLSVK